jgi:hypothetical protein
MKKHLLLFLSFLIFIFAWIVRMTKIGFILQNGILPDFFLFYQAVNHLYGINQNLNLVVKSSYGPPFIYVPFLIFMSMPFKFAEYLLTTVNIAAYLLSFYLLIKIKLKKFTTLSWLLIALMSFSFPVTYSLGMGNPIGLITLGIYGLFIFKNKYIKSFLFTISSLIKIFPLIVLGAFKKKEIFENLRIFIVGLIFSFLILPIKIWAIYFDRLIKINPINKTVINSSIYNQSFSSTIARFSGVYEFSPIFYYFLIIFLTILLIYFIFLTKRIKTDSLDCAIYFLSFILLIHPYPWQYYFAIFLPFLILKISQKKYFFLIPLILISIDGNRFIGNGFINAFLNSAQFFSVFIIYFTILFLTVWKNLSRAFSL